MTKRPGLCCFKVDNFRQGKPGSMMLDRRTVYVESWCRECGSRIVGIFELKKIKRSGEEKNV